MMFLPKSKLLWRQWRKRQTNRRKEFDALSPKFDSATAEIEKLKADAEKQEADFKAKFDEAVKTTIELRSIAQKHGIEKADEMSNDEIKKAVVAKVHPKLNLDGKSAEYIELLSI